jgi:hypothetical protein
LFENSEFSTLCFPLLNTSIGGALPVIF